MNRLEKKVNEAADVVKATLDRPPEVAVITGTGLGNAVGPLDDETVIPYDRIPHFPVSTVAGHPGRLIVGNLENAPVMIMQGRIHLYEGYTPGQVTFPIRVMQVLGVRRLILSNAAGGLNAAFQEGDLMVIRDHINLTGENPLIGPNNDDWGPRFPDMTSAYPPSLNRLAREEGLRLALPIVEGVYAGLKGPSLETPAEVRFLKTIGADAVGFSTVMETVAAVHGGLRVLGLSTITNTIDPDNPVPATLEEIVETANRAAPKLRRLIEGIIDRHEGGETT